MIQYSATVKLRPRSRVLIRKRASIACRERETQSGERTEVFERKKERRRNEKNTEFIEKVEKETCLAERRHMGKYVGMNNVGVWANEKKCNLTLLHCKNVTHKHSGQQDFLSYPSK